MSEQDDTEDLRQEIERLIWKASAEKLRIIRQVLDL